MKRSRFSEEQIIGILKEHQAGMTPAELCCKHGISDATFYTWRKNYGGMDVSASYNDTQVTHIGGAEFSARAPDRFVGSRNSTLRHYLLAM